MAKEECIKTKNAFTEKFITKCERPALDYGQEKMDTIWSLFHGDIINGGFHDLSHHDLTHTISFSTFSIDFSIFDVRKKFISNFLIEFCYLTFCMLWCSKMKEKVSKNKIESFKSWKMRKLLIDKGLHELRHS